MEEEEKHPEKEEEKSDGYLDSEDYDVGEMYDEKMRTKEDFVDLCSYTGYYTKTVPFTTEFFQKVIEGTKSLLRMEQVRYFPGTFPRDRELSAQRLWRTAYNDKAIRSYFPDKHTAERAPAKHYLVLVLYSLRKR